MTKEITKRIDFLGVFVICFCLGICLGKFWHMPFLSLYIVAWVTAILSFIFLKQSKSVMLLLFLGIILGAITLKNSQKLNANHIFWFTSYKGKPVFIQGLVDDDPIYKTSHSEFVLKARKLKFAQGWHEVSGRVLVKVFAKQRFDYGEEILIEGKLYKPLRLRLADGFNYRSYLENKNIYR